MSNPIYHFEVAGDVPSPRFVTADMALIHTTAWFHANYNGRFVWLQWIAEQILRKFGFIESSRKFTASVVTLNVNQLRGELEHHLYAIEQMTGKRVVTMLVGHDMMNKLCGSEFYGALVLDPNPCVDSRLWGIRVVFVPYLHGIVPLLEGMINA